MSTLQIFGVRVARPEQIEDDASATAKLIRTYLSGFEPKVDPDLQHGWWLSYSGEYQREDGWRTLGGIGYLGLGLGIPFIGIGRTHVYSSPPIVGVAQE